MQNASQATSAGVAASSASVPRGTHVTDTRDSVRIPVLVVRGESVVHWVSQYVIG